MNIPPEFVYKGTTVSGRMSLSKPNMRSIPKHAPRVCPHGRGYNCLTCYPTMPLTENNYRSRP